MAVISSLIHQFGSSSQVLCVRATGYRPSPSPSGGVAGQNLIRQDASTRSGPASSGTSLEPSHATHFDCVQTSGPCDGGLRSCFLSWNHFIEGCPSPVGTGSRGKRSRELGSDGYRLWQPGSSASALCRLAQLWHMCITKCIVCVESMGFCRTKCHPTPDNLTGPGCRAVLFDAPIYCQYGRQNTTTE